MDGIKVKIVEYIDSHFPGWVRCSFQDIYNVEYFVTEKVPVVTQEDLHETSIYPRFGVIAGEIEKTYINSNKQEIVTINIEKPWGIETEDGKSVFDVYKNQLASW